MNTEEKRLLLLNIAHIFVFVNRRYILIDPCHLVSYKSELFEILVEAHLASRKRTSRDCVLCNKCCQYIELGDGIIKILRISTVKYFYLVYLWCVRFYQLEEFA